MAYIRVTEEERRHICRWRQEGLGNNEIARRLGRAPSTISREIARNIGDGGYRHRREGDYCHKQAQQKAQERAKRPGPRRFTEEVRADVDLQLARGWTPDIISGRARLEKRPWVCKETIYTYIYADAKAGGKLWEYLPRARRKRRRRCPRQEGRGRGRIPNQRMIDTRPPEVEARGTVGHWEGDLINGAHKTGNMVTLVERKTRFTLVGYSLTKGAEDVTSEICRLFSMLRSEACLGLTLDNGKEFARHEQIAKVTGMDVYFAHPYHSWERGTNENTNGLIRRLHPKKSSFIGIDRTELERIDKYLNDRPRKCLKWRTPREEMNAFLAAS